MEKSFGNTCRDICRRLIANLHTLLKILRVPVLKKTPFKKLNKPRDPENRTLFSGTYPFYGSIGQVRRQCPVHRGARSTLSGGICWLNFLLLYCMGGSREFRKGWPGHLAALFEILFIFLRQNSVKIIQNFKGKGVAAATSAHPKIRPCNAPPGIQRSLSESGILVSYIANSFPTVWAAKLSLALFRTHLKISNSAKAF